MKYVYNLRTDIIPDENGDYIETYGIDILSSNGENVESIPDICFDRIALRKLISVCRKSQPDTDRIYKIIEDFME